MTRYNYQRLGPNNRLIFSGDDLVGMTNPKGVGADLILTGAAAATQQAMDRFGVKADGITDDTVALQRVLDSLVTTARQTAIVFPPGMRIKINSGITIVLPLADIGWNGAVIDASGMTSGFAMTLIGQTAYPYNQYSPSLEFGGFVLVGPDTDASVVDGIAIGQIGSTLNPGHVMLRKINVRGFRDNIVIGDHAYIMSFHGIYSQDAHRYGLHYLSFNDSGEAMNFFGGSFSDCRNAGGTAVGIFMPAGTYPSALTQATLNFYGTSNDYNDIGVDCRSGQITWHGGSLESNNDNPHVKISQNVPNGARETQVLLHGVRLVQGSLGGGAGEASTGRPTFIDITGTGDNLSVDIDSCNWYNFGKYSTELLRYGGGGANRPKMSIRNPLWVAQGNAFGKLCDEISVLALANWSVSGANSYQDVWLLPGEQFVVRADVSADPSIHVIAVAPDGTTELSNITMPAPSGGTRMSQRFRMPRQTQRARVQVATANLGLFTTLAGWKV